MKKYYSLTIPAIFLLINLGYGQNPTLPGNLGTINSSESEKSLEDRLAGTYQIIIIDSKITEVFTTEILMEIEKRRDDNMDVYYDISNYTRIKILPRNVVNAPGFDPEQYHIK